MQLTCAREQLSQAMGQAASIVNQRSVNPITQNVLLVADKHGLEIRATDLELSLRRKLAEVEVRKPGKCLVNAAVLGGLLKDIRSETVDLSAEGSTVEIKAGRDRFELTSADPEEFPRLPETNADTELSLSMADFADAIRKVGRSIAQEKGRYALNGVLIEPRKNGIEYCGTDGRRLGYVKTAGKGKEVKYQVILPAKGFNLITRALEGEAELTLKLSENRVQASAGDTEVGSVLVEGQFPDYRSVIPGDLDKSFKINTDDFRLALSKTRHLTSVESQAVRLEIAPGELTLRSRSPASGQAEVKVEIEYDGPETVLGFDPQYILQGLDGFDSDQVSVEFKDKDTGAILHAGDKERFYYLVMPIDL
jgi:DNA polymerase III subunit beta